MKRNRLVTIFFLLVLSFVIPERAKSQMLEVGATAGMSYYIGDVNPTKHFTQNNIAYGGLVRYYDNLRWAFRLQYSRFDIAASNVADYVPDKDYAFESAINDFAFMAEFNFFDYCTGSSKNIVSPYLFAGISTSAIVLYGKGEPQYDEKGNQIKDEEGDLVRGDRKLSSMSIPFGVGVKCSLAKRLGMTLEWRFHKSFTDEIDDVVNNGQILNGEGGITYKPISYYACDWYNILSLSITYSFNLPKKDACYSGIKPRL